MTAGAVMITMQFWSNEQIVEQTHSQVEVEVADRAVKRDHGTEHEYGLRIVAQQPDRSDLCAVTDWDGVERMKDCIITTMLLLRPVVVSVARRTFSARLHRVHVTMNRVLKRFEYDKTDNEMNPYRHACHQPQRVLRPSIARQFNA